MIPPEPLTQILHHIQVVKYLNVASTIVLIYDYFLTVNLEYRYVWTHNWNTVQAFFYISRYLPFIDIGMSLFSQLRPGISSHDCKIIYHTTCWLFTTGMAAGEAILTIRTWILWDNSRRIGYCLAILFMLFWVPIFVVMGLFIVSTEPIPILHPKYEGCFSSSGNRLLFVCFVLLMVFDGAIMLVMLLRSSALHQQAQGSPLLATIVRDGITYYVLIFALSAINVATILALPKEFVNLLSTLERALHAILTCRMILHLRHQAARRSTFTESQLSTVGTLPDFGRAA